MKEFLAVATPSLLAVGAFLGALVTAAVSRRFDRAQQARPLLLEPAEQFARSALATLAALRHVTPPRCPPEQDRPHRNDDLMDDVKRRIDRLDACRDLLDAVREARAHVRLVFTPRSQAAELSRRVLEDLRFCLESAECLYRDYDLDGDGDAIGWRTGPAAGEDRAEYKRLRIAAYDDLDAFYEDVAQRLVAPSWKPSRIAPPSVRPTEVHQRTRPPHAKAWQARDADRD